MSRVSKNLNSFEKTSGTNDRILKSMSFDAENRGAQTLNVPTHVWDLQVPNSGLNPAKMVDYLISLRFYTSEIKGVLTFWLCTSMKH